MVTKSADIHAKATNASRYTNFSTTIILICCKRKSKYCRTSSTSTSTNERPSIFPSITYYTTTAVGTACRPPLTLLTLAVIQEHSIVTLHHISCTIARRTTARRTTLLQQSAHQSAHMLAIVGSTQQSSRSTNRSTPQHCSHPLYRFHTR